MKRLLAILLAALPAAAQLPDMYKSVDRVVWVVDSKDKVTDAWQKAGFAQIQNECDNEYKVEFRGKPVTESFHLTNGYFGDVRMECVSPTKGGGAYAEFLKKNREGMYALVLQSGDVRATESNLAARGVKVRAAADSKEVLEIDRETTFGALFRIESTSA